MELYLSILAVAFMILLLVNFYLLATVKSLSKKFKELGSKLALATGSIEYIKGIELDVSVLEDKFKDEIEQLQVQIENVSNKVTEEIDNQDKSIEELKSEVEDLGELEGKIEDEIETKVEEKMKEFDEKNNQ